MYTHAGRERRISLKAPMSAGYRALSGLTFSYAPPDRIFAQDGNFDFPSLAMCVWGSRGCDEILSGSDCIGSAVFSVYDQCGDETTEAIPMNQVRHFFLSGSDAYLRSTIDSLSHIRGFPDQGTSKPVEAKMTFQCTQSPLVRGLLA